MAKRLHFLVIFFMFNEVLQTIHSEKNPFNPFGPELDKKPELGKPELGNGETFGNFPQNKTIEKRRLIYNEGSNNSPLNTERQSDNKEHLERKRNSFGESSENENETPAYTPRKEWNFGSKFSLPATPENFRNPEEFTPRQPYPDHIRLNQKIEGEMGDAFEKTSRWNEQRNFKQLLNSEGPRVDLNFRGRTSPIMSDSEISEYSQGRPNDFFDRRFSITTLNEMDVRNNKNYNENVGERPPSYLGHPSMRNYNRNPHNYWPPNFHRPEKEVVINFNTDCPTPRQFNNQLVHKFIFAPKPSITPQRSQHEVSNIQIPETAFLSGHKVFPIYYV